MRLAAVFLCGGLAACTSGAVTVPDSNVITEVPQARDRLFPERRPRGDEFTSTIERVAR